MKLTGCHLFLFIALCEGKNVPDIVDVKLNTTLQDKRIVGGAPTDILNHPYQASLEYYYRHVCGAALISNRWLLSAAHCTQIIHEVPPLFAFTVRLGSSFVEAEGHVFSISRIIDHPGYGNTDNRFDYDITLLQLSRSVTFTDSIQPVALPADNAPKIPGSPCVVTGWGALTQGGLGPSRLHAVTVPLISNESCNEYYREAIDYISYSMMCAGSPYGGRDACQGDSGGPLTVHNILFGIVSWGYGCAQPNYPGVYANVPALRSWIRENSGI